MRGKINVSKILHTLFEHILKSVMKKEKIRTIQSLFVAFYFHVISGSSIERLIVIRFQFDCFGGRINTFLFLSLNAFNEKGNTRKRKFALALF